MKLARCWDFIVYLTKRLINEGIGYRASALTYTTLLSLVPLMSVMFFALHAFPVYDEIGNEAQQFIFSNFIPETGSVVMRYLQQFVDQTAKLSATGLLFLIFAAIMMLYTLEETLNSIWRIPFRRKGVYAFLLYWAALTLLPLLIGASIAVSSYVFSLPFLNENVANLKLRVLALLPFLLSCCSFILLYWIVPNCSVPKRAAIAGGLVAAILFALAKQLFGLYLTHFPTYQLLYGAMATIPIFLLWLYITWLIILFGAIISHALFSFSWDRRGANYNGFVRAVLWLGHMWHAQQKGEVLSLQDLVTLVPNNENIDCMEILGHLLKNDWIKMTSRGRYVLCRDLTSANLAHLYHSGPWQLPCASDLSKSDDPWVKRLSEALAENERTMHASLQVNIADVCHCRR